MHFYIPHHEDYYKGNKMEAVTKNKGRSTLCVIIASFSYNFYKVTISVCTLLLLLNLLYCKISSVYILVVNFL